MSPGGLTLDLRRGILLLLLFIFFLIIFAHFIRQSPLFRDFFPIVCENNGIPRSGYCECPDFFVGLRCETDLFYHTKHIPPAKEVIPLPHLTTYGVKLQTLLTTLHNPEDCRQARGQNFPEFGSSGIGSDLRWLVRPFSQAVRNRALVLPYKFWPWAPKNCRPRNYQCYLEPFSRCDASTVGKVIPYSRELLAPPTNSEFAGLNSVWYRGNLLNFAIKPHASITEKILNIKAKLGFPPPHQVIALHVRGGDSCHVEERVCYRLKDYMKTIYIFRELYGVNTIYLSTDSQDAIDETKYFPEFRFMYLDVDRKHYDEEEFVEDRREEGKLDVEYEVTLSITDIFLMSECGYFLGTFSSNFGRMAFEMMVAKLNYIPPYASLDIGWCTHWMIDEETILRRDIEGACEWV